MTFDDALVEVMARVPLADYVLDKWESSLVIKSDWLNCTYRTPLAINDGHFEVWATLVLNHGDISI